MTATRQTPEVSSEREGQPIRPLQPDRPPISEGPHIDLCAIVRGGIAAADFLCPQPSHARRLSDRILEERRSPRSRTETHPMPTGAAPGGPAAESATSLSHLNRGTDGKPILSRSIACNR